MYAKTRIIPVLDNLFKHTVVFLLLLLLPFLIFSPALQLGTLDYFEGFTGLGALINSRTFTGDVVTNAGIITGF